MRESIPKIGKTEKISNQRNELKPRNKKLKIRPVTNIAPYIQALLKKGKACGLVPRK